jgi:hypothetical protein
MESPNFSGPRVGNFSPSGIAGVSHGDDAALLVQFYLHPVRQGGASERAGRDIYKDEEYVWIRFAGDRTKEIRRPVDLRGTNGAPPDPVRWPNAWAAFKNSQAQVQEGTPLEQFPALGTSTVLNFKAYNIHTVEQLASVSDAVIHNLGTGATDLREKARVWLKAAQDTSLVTSLQSELKKRDMDIAALREQIAEIAKSKKAKD